MRSRAPLAKLTLGLLIACATSAIPSPAAASSEFRLKLNADYLIWHYDSDDVDTGVRPFMLLEQRYHGDSLSFFKITSGVRSDVLPWMRLALAYAHKDVLSDARHHDDLAIFDLILHRGFGQFWLWDRHENEWHSGDGFYRYRNYLRVGLRPGLSWLRLWVGDEVRVDSDEGRLNMNDLLAGADIDVAPQLVLSVFYDIEQNRRGRDHFRRTDALQLIVIFRGRRPESS